MKKFNFKLASVRNQREMIRDREQQALAQYLTALAAARQQLSALEDELIEARQRSLRLGVPVNTEDLRLSALYQEQLRSRIKAAQAEVENVEREMERQRQRTIEAEKRLKMIDRLGERQRAAHHLATERETQNETDELSALRSAHAKHS